LNPIRSPGSGTSRRSFGSGFAGFGRLGSLFKEALEEGLLIHINFIFGMDHDNEESIELIDRFCAKYPVFANFFFLTPFPNQPFTQRLKKEGRLRNDNYWDSCNLYNLVFEPKNISKERLYQQVTALHGKYYSLDHWKEIYTELQSIRHNKGYSVLGEAASSFNYGIKPRMNQSYSFK
jgi:hypothetical protein